VQVLLLAQTGADKHGQAPQALGLRHPLPKRGTAVLVRIKLKLELPLKFALKDGVVWGSTQETVDHGDQGDVSFHGAEVPQLILVKPFGLAFFVIDFNGLITNDKFCLSRQGELQLTWWRRPLRLRENRA